MQPWFHNKLILVLVSRNWLDWCKIMGPSTLLRKGLLGRKGKKKKERIEDRDCLLSTSCHNSFYKTITTLCSLLFWKKLIVAYRPVVATISLLQPKKSITIFSCHLVEVAIILQHTYLPNLGDSIKNIFHFKWKEEPK